MLNIQFVILLLSVISIPAMMWVYWWYTGIWWYSFCNNSSILVKTFMCLMLTIITTIAIVSEIIMMDVVIESTLGIFI